MSRARVHSAVKPILHRRWISAPTMQSIIRGGSPFGTIGRVWITEVDIPWRMEVDQIAYQVGGVGAGNVRVGIYKEGGTIDSPAGGALVWESASTAQLVTINRFQFFDISPAVVLAPGRYYLCVQGDNITGESGIETTIYRSATVSYDMAFWYDHAYGAFTDPCPAVNHHSESTIFVLRVSRNLG